MKSFAAEETVSHAEYMYSSVVYVLHNRRDWICLSAWLSTGVMHTCLLPNGFLFNNVCRGYHYRQMQRFFALMDQTKVNFNKNKPQTNTCN